MNDSLKNEAKILIILMGALGDVARGLVVAGKIKAIQPNCNISWLVEPKCEELVRLCSNVDNVIVFDRKRGLAAVPTLASILRSGCFDIVLDMQRHFKSGIFSWLTRAPRRIGFNRANAKEFNWLFNNEFIPAFPLESAKLKQYLSFAEVFGIKSEGVLDAGLSYANTSRFEGLVAKGYAVVVLGSSWNSKDWPLDGYKRLLKLLLEREKCSIVLLGDKTKLEMANNLASSTNNSRVFNLAGKTNLRDVLDLIGNAAFCVGPDSGPGHLAGALGIPYVTIFGPTSPARTSPSGSESLVVQSKIGCAPCYMRECPGLGKLCMRLVTAESVMEKVATITSAGSQGAKPQFL